VDDDPRQESRTTRLRAWLSRNLRVIVPLVVAGVLAGAILAWLGLAGGGSALRADLSTDAPTTFPTTRTTTETSVTTTTAVPSGTSTTETTAATSLSERSTTTSILSSMTTSSSAPATAVQDDGERTYLLAVTGEIEIEGDYDEWRFEGSKGDVVTVEAIGGNGLDRLEAHAYEDLTGNRVGGDPFGGCSSGVAYALNFTLPNSGTYTARVTSCQGRTGTYELTLSRK